MKKINVSFFTVPSFVLVFRSLPLLCFKLFLSLLCLFFNFTLHSCLSHSHLPISSSPCGLHLITSFSFCCFLFSLFSSTFSSSTLLLHVSSILRPRSNPSPGFVMGFVMFLAPSAAAVVARR